MSIFSMSSLDIEIFDGVVEIVLNLEGKEGKA
jgi:hypothetical protein